MVEIHKEATTIKETLTVPPEKPSFSRALTEGSTLTRDELEDYAKDLLGNNIHSLNPVVKEKAADLPFDAPDNVNGALLGRKIYLVSSNIRNAAHARQVIAHEVIAHYGLRGFFGKDLDIFLDAIHKYNPTIQKYADRWCNNTDVISLHDNLPNLK